MAQRSSRSTWYASSANLGSCPVAVSVPVQHEARRPDLLVGIPVAVEGELTQRPRHGRAGAPQHDEHRTGDLDPGLDVQDAERRPGLPVRHALVVGVAVGAEVLDPHDHVRGLVGAVGCVGGWGVGDAQHQIAQLGGNRGDLVVELLLPALQLTALALHGLGLVDVAVAPEIADLLRQLLAPRPQVVALGCQRTLVAVERARPPRASRRLRPGGPAQRPRRRNRSAAGERRAWMQPSGSARWRRSTFASGEGRPGAVGSTRSPAVASPPVPPSSPSSPPRSPLGPAVEVRELDDPLRRRHRRRLALTGGRAGHGAGPARAERRRQDVDGRDPRGLPPTRRAAGRGARPGSSPRPRRADPPRRRDAPGGRRLHRHPPRRGAAPLRLLLRRPRGSRRAARPGRARRAPSGDLEDVVGRRAAAPVAGAGARGPTGGGVPRRARPRGSTPAGARSCAR